METSTFEAMFAPNKIKRKRDVKDIISPRSLKRVIPKGKCGIGHDFPFKTYKWKRATIIILKNSCTNVPILKENLIFFTSRYASMTYFPSIVLDQAHQIHAPKS